MDHANDGISEPAGRAARDLRVLVGRLRRRLREVDDVGELTPSQLSVLSRLDRNGAASPSDLAAAEHVRPQSMGATLAALAERGLTDRHPDPTDGRRHLVSLSALGHESIRGTRQVREEWLARALQDRFTEAERHTVTEALALLERLTHQ